MTVTKTSGRTGGKGRDLLRGEQGTSAVEFALVLPVLLAFFFGIIEFGRYMWAENSLRFAVQEGARCAALNCCDLPGASCGSPEALAASRATGIDVASTDFILDLQDCGKRLRAGSDGSGIVFDFAFGELFSLAGLQVTLQAEACYPTLDR